MNKPLKKIAFLVTLGTLASKLGGLSRQLVIAGCFGIGAAYDAYNYAYVIPGFFLILLGGINGPFHNSMVSILSKKNKAESSYILSSISTIVSLFLIITTIILILAADPIIHLIAPGLDQTTHDIAVIQTKIMAPIAILAGLIGLSFGSLNAKNEFLIPSISPLISSVFIIIFVGIFWLKNLDQLSIIDLQLKGGIILAAATLIGAIFQLIIQIPALNKNGIKPYLKLDLNHPGVKELLRVIIPATLSTGMLQINVFTDLFFASNIVGAAAALTYANFIVQTPLGIASNALLIPLLPTFSKLTKPKDRSLLIKRIEQGLILTISSMVILGALFIALGEPIVSLIYERGAFNEEAVKIVKSLLIAYGIGMPAYLARDLLVRVFYSLGDAVIPFKISSVGIIFNIIFDWLLVGGPSPWGNQSPFNYGISGIVLATAAINFLACILLLFALNRKLISIPLLKWCINIFKILLAGVISGVLASFICAKISYYNDLMESILKVFIPSIISFISYILICNLMEIKEINDLTRIFNLKLLGR